ncbi:hypothetical protein P154DRAFT_447694 [Amniculicola lignicola CBS 123094]|uniref:Serine hydrolase domain-containing protein n=1 Tax=Amniculicola lignicola CBS 123094 TaxID=1392246 RepID=A0A6A5VXB5_9PLEO|nr:hypothetical protein P154DRAFT_447694 [Amniculicola lignicola CBS 123094]
MKFLCLHEMGTNSKIMAAQTAAIRHELGSEHEYIYVDGALECEPAPGAELMSSDYSGFLHYFNHDSLESCKQAMDDLDKFIKEVGPFDAVMAFSEGAALAATLMVESKTPKFKWAVFFCGGIPYDLPRRCLMSKDKNANVIRIPTAHIRVQGDPIWPGFGRILSDICDPHTREDFIHDGGHAIPGPRHPARVKAAVKCIKRTMMKV